MISQSNKTVLRLPFESALDVLKRQLHGEGFEVGGMTDFHGPGAGMSITNGKYKIVDVYHPSLYKEMLMLSTFDGTVLPCVLSVIELYPGETAVIPYYATEHIARQMSFFALESLAMQVSKKIDDVIHALVSAQTEGPDLVTSWS